MVNWKCLTCGKKNSDRSSICVLCNQPKGSENIILRNFIISNKKFFDIDDPKYTVKIENDNSINIKDMPQNYNSYSEYSSNNGDFSTNRYFNADSFIGNITNFTNNITEHTGRIITNNNNNYSGGINMGFVGSAKNVQQSGRFPPTIYKKIKGILEVSDAEFSHEFFEKTMNIDGHINKVELIRCKNVDIPFLQKLQNDGYIGSFEIIG